MPIIEPVLPDIEALLPEHSDPRLILAKVSGGDLLICRLAIPQFDLEPSPSPSCSSSIRNRCGSQTLGDPYIIQLENKFIPIQFQILDPVKEKPDSFGKHVKAITLPAVDLDDGDL